MVTTLVTPNLAPIYRYYTVDLLTNEVLAEIPFGSVTYERAVKAAGKFSGKIPAIEGTKHLDLYESTIPGKTALFVVRNGICVWGGIIWTRSYNVVDRVLNVSASEFTSYLYHRRIWKTWGHTYEGVVTVNTLGQTSVQLVNGSTTALKPGATVHLEFYEVENFKYNDFFTVSDAPTPTRNKFNLTSANQTVGLSTIARGSGTTKVVTSALHHYAVGDIITIAGTGTSFDGAHTVTSVSGASGYEFSYTDGGATVAEFETSGTSTRAITPAVYGSVTVTVRTDTFEYIRDMLDGVFGDFMGIDFPNVYIEPGIRYPVDVTNLEVSFGRARITTKQPHNLTIGQAVELRDVHPLVNGEQTVLDTPSETQFEFAQSGTIVSTVKAPKETSVSAVEAKGGVAFLTVTSTAGFSVGETIHVDCAALIPDAGDIFSGDYTIASIPTSTLMTYNIASNETFPLVSLTQATATVGATTTKVTGRKLEFNTVTLTTLEPHGYAVGNSVTTANIVPRYAITQKALDAATSTAEITTEVPHYLSTGDVVTISGLRDSSNVIGYSQTGTSVTLTTNQGHNFKIGDTLNVENVLDVYTLTVRQLTSNVATLTTSVNHNLGYQVGQKVVVSDIYDTYTPNTKQLTDGLATLTLTINHNFKVNDNVTITNIIDTAFVKSKAVEANVVTLGTTTAHNFIPGEKVTIQFLGDLYDGEVIILESLPRQFTYRLTDAKVEALVNSYIQQGKTDKAADIKANGLYASPTVANGQATSSSSIFNGEYTIESVTLNTISYRRAGEDIPATAVGAGFNPRVAGWSIFNGEHTIASASGNTFTYALTGNNIPFTNIEAPPQPDRPGAPADPPATATTISLANGTRTVTAMNRNSLTFTATGGTQVPRATTGVVSANSLFNGTRTVTAVPTAYRFNLTISAPTNLLETTVTNKAHVTVPNLFNGTYTIASVPSANKFTYSKTHGTIPEVAMRLPGTATVSPLAIVSTFGPYPLNSDIGIDYSTRLASGVNVLPTMYRGFELANVGEALDKYSDSLDGFEYRIDCFFDEATNSFRKVFVLIPINFPNPPAPGEVSPVSRFGADRLVFEYPGNIINVNLEESAENSSTRFFAVGENDLGADAGPPFSVAVADDLLNRRGRDESFREWPILDDDEKIDEIDDEAVLYSYAQRYLNETRPPEGKLTVSVNGSLQPLVGSYAPGDWCSLIVRDEFIQRRLETDLEPRDTVIVRKIDSMKVTVPDGTTFPEKVDLILVPEWEVDKIGE